ncbi:MAG: STAS domain-containing protein [Deltaproteobacteria bacterium]|nr:STAS domain-containing protein [Deltaproteobacteria bacterium]
MELITENIGEITIVTLLAEELDAANAKWFKSQMLPVVEKSKKIVLDMNQVQFVDSSGCGALLSSLRTITSKGGDMKLASVQKPVQTLFELIRLHRIVEISEDREMAIRSFE